MEGFIMAFGIGSLAVLFWLFWLLWSKLHNIEEKLFRIHDDMSLSLQQMEKDLNIIQDKLNRIENKDIDF